MRLRFGCFAFAYQIEKVEELGYDSIELDLGEIVAMSQEEFFALKEKIQKSKLGFEVFSGLLPLSVRFHAEDFDEERWMRYVEVASERAATLGARMIPFGAGKCRSIPENCQDILAAKDRVLHIVQRISDILGKHNLLLAVEPLGPANSNYINTIPEADEFIGKVSRPNCVTMCDLRHMFKMEETFENIVTYSSVIHHAHIDYPRGFDRLFPQDEDDYDYMPYMEALCRSGYDGILTIEATSFHDFEKEAGSALAYLKKMQDCCNAQ